MTGATDNKQNIAILVSEHTDKILVLVQSGFFTMKNGSFTVHFDAAGNMRKVEKHFVLNIN